MRSRPIRLGGTRSPRSSLVLLLAGYLSTAYAFSADGASVSPGEALRRTAEATIPDASHGEALYRQHCTRCHHTRGNGAGNREYAQLSGQREDYLLTQLSRFVTLEREAPRMHRVLEAPDLDAPQALHDLAAYLAGQSHDPHGEHGDGHFLGTGRRVYQTRCAGCHGARGEGSAIGPTPSVSSQNYTYLRAQLVGFAAGHRAKADPAILTAVRSLSPDEMSAVADYISRLPESADPRFGVISP